MKKMKLTAEEKAILNGSQGEVMAKILKTLVMFGEAVGATDFVPVKNCGHIVTSFGLKMITPVYKIMDEIIAAGIKAPYGFTADPRPIDYENVKCNPLEKLVFSKFMYSKQKDYEEQLTKIGLKNKDSFTCACYLDDVGNKPKYGEAIGWAESSAVVFANSVLGARCNRNSGMIDIFQSIACRALNYGFMKDEGRKAKWIVEIKTTKKPEAQVLGSAIGMKVVEDVPYVIGLDKWIGKEINEDVISYLKDFGAATASNGAVGLYHIDNVTPEAKEKGKELILPDAKVYVIDDAEIERVYKSYPVMWKNPDAKPKLCFIGCPHATFKQLNWWTEHIGEKLKVHGRKKVNTQTVITAAPAVAEKFRKTENYQKLLSYGVKLSSICPLMYTNNPLVKSKPIITSSNKLRTYSNAKYLMDEDILETITK